MSSNSKLFPWTKKRLIVLADPPNNTASKDMNLQDVHAYTPNRVSLPKHKTEATQTSLTNCQNKTDHFIWSYRKTGVLAGTRKSSRSHLTHHSIIIYLLLLYFPTWAGASCGQELTYSSSLNPATFVELVINAWMHSLTEHAHFIFILSNCGRFVFVTSSFS